MSRISRPAGTRRPAPQANYSYKLALLRHRRGRDAARADLSPELRRQLLAAAAAARPAPPQPFLARRPNYRSPYAPPGAQHAAPLPPPPMNPAAAQLMAAYFAAQARGPPAPAPAPAP